MNETRALVKDQGTGDRRNGGTGPEEPQSSRNEPHILLARHGDSLADRLDRY